MNRKLLNLIQTQKGLALVSVLAMVTLATVIILALFSVSDSEFKASKVYAGGNAARQLADSAVNIVIGQIRSATYSSPTVTRIWVSQPGGIRVYDTHGGFYRGHKLYSDATMIVSTPGTGGESSMANDPPASDWNQHPNQYVDLNEPVIRIQGEQTKLYFPIVDPRAAYDDPGTSVADQVEGFSYTTGGINGVVTPGGTGGANALRLPMPVEWMYVLQDGSLGTVDQGGNWVGGGTPSATNQIIGRIAFWTDDESCKLNINTASEPGYWAVPSFFHERDKGWAECPPTLHEYQRFPGHPATVALSTVLYPSTSPSSPRFLDTYPGLTVTTPYPGLATNTTPQTAFALKQRMYQILPKLNGGGSNDGNLVYRADDLRGDTEVAQPIDLNVAATERLYANLDELLFSEAMTNGRRTENDFTVNVGAMVTMLTPATLEQSRFFLTANSRAPELNLFGRPRVAIWPIPDQTLNDRPDGPFRTGYDSAIALAATLSSNPNSLNTYYFSRKNADSALQDIGHDTGGVQGLERNLRLMSYLDQLMAQQFPAGGASGRSFATKYPGAAGGPADFRQILVEIFDYIRCTNLYDSFLAPKWLKPGEKESDGSSGPLPDWLEYRWRTDTSNWGLNDKSKSQDDYKSTDLLKVEEKTIYRTTPVNSQGDTKYRTYTEPRFKVSKYTWTGTPTDVDLANQVVPSGAYPGHGQVTPAEWQIGGQKYKGFGRFPTLSEIGLEFICTADGMNDEGSYRIRQLQSAGPPPVYTIPDYTGPTMAGISGGRTAEKIREDWNNNQRIAQTFVDPFTRQNTREYWYSNYPPFPTRDTIEGYGCRFDVSPQDPRHPLRHPGCQPVNWNATLAQNTPLEPDEKRIQVALLLEFFIPAMGWTKYAPEFTVVLDGDSLSGIQVKDSSGAYAPVFSTTGDQVLKSNLQFSGGADGLGDNHNIYPLGGNFSPRAMTAGRRVKGVGGMPSDPGYDDDATSSDEAGVYNYPFVSSFVTVKRDEPLSYKVLNPIRIKIYDNHKWQQLAARRQEVQSIEVKFPAQNDRAPSPELVRYSTQQKQWENTNGTRYEQEETHAVRWWCFNFGGAVRRWEGTGSFSAGGVNWNRVNESKYENTVQASPPYRGRFASHGSHSRLNVTKDEDSVNGIEGNIATNGLIYGYSSADTKGTKSRADDRKNKDKYVPQGGVTSMGEYGFYGADVVRSMIPKYGDYRILAGRKTVSADMWVKHYLWDSQSFFAHNFSSFFSRDDPGFHRGGNTDETVDNKYRLVQFPASTNPTTAIDYQDDWVPDMPQTEKASTAAKRYGDFDNGPGNARDGAYINKPDEGNLSVMKLYLNKDQRLMRNAYFKHQWMQMPASESFYTPNRMISSPGVFGSLPTGVFGSIQKLQDRDANVHGEPWRTLLFRPAFGTGHPGAPLADGGIDPADHYIMDLFWMPVVEPYAISDSWSTAGKVNMNFQIVPFTYINRATGMYAAMKGELITAIPTADAKIFSVKQRSGNPQTKGYKQYKDETDWPPLFFSEQDGKYWHRYIDLAQTTTEMKNRMDMQGTVSKRGLFRTASQICEIPLWPQTIAGAPVNPGTSMNTFWQQNALTGDNTRERPYLNLYQKLTTRSNTFRVYYRAQSLRKARSLAPGTVNTVAGTGQSTDTVVAEYRGSALIERYLDLGATVLPDYASGSPMSQPSLESFYRYRVVESKQFAP